jgi:mono/diheme cytochrome c family protein
MNSNLIRAFTVVTFAISAIAIAHAQQPGQGQGVDVGKYEYDAHCASCHGVTGKGDGPYASELKKGVTVADLTGLAKKNNGVFPFQQVYETIDGRKFMKAHGSREMPIWGRSFTVESARLNPFYNPEEFTRAKILALTEYIYRLQAK